MSVLNQIAEKFIRRKEQTHRVARVCGKTLSEVGLNLMGNVYRLQNTKGREGWLISIFIPFSMTFRPVDALVLKNLLIKRVAHELDIAPDSFTLVLNMNSEASQAPSDIGPSAVEWLRKRVAWYKQQHTEQGQLQNLQTEALQGRLRALLSGLDEDSHFTQPLNSCTDF